MSTMIVEVYDAFRAANVPDEQAKAAARALTVDLNTEVTSLRSEIAALRKETAAEFVAVRSELAAHRKETAAEFASIRTELAVIRWMLGFVLAFLAAISAKVFFG